MAAKRKRQEEQECIRKEAHDSRSAKEYAQNMLEWGRMVQIHNENIQKFMENLAAHTGMPATQVPPTPPPPPLPPAFGVSMSPNQSVQNVGTFHSSSVQVETPEETLSRIAYGGFGGPVNATTSGGDPVNATTSGGGNYSPDQDQFPLY